MLDDQSLVILVLACRRHAPSWGAEQWLAIVTLTVMLFCVGPMLLGRLINWWLDGPPKHIPTGHCGQCDYDLDGLPADCTCPECGRALARAGP